VEGNDLVHLIADPEHRVQGGHRLLKDHGYIVAPEVLHLLLGRFYHIICLSMPQIQPDLALDDLALRPLDQLHQAQAGNGFAAAGFPYHAHGLADGNIEGDAVYALYRAGIRKEIGVKIIELHRILGIVHGGQILALGYVFALSLLFKLIGNFTIFFGNPPGFFGGHISFCLFFSHCGFLLIASSWDQMHPEGHRPRS